MELVQFEQFKGQQRVSLSNAKRKKIIDVESDRSSSTTSMDERSSSAEQTEQQPSTSRGSQNAYDNILLLANVAIMEVITKNVCFNKKN